MDVNCFQNKRIENKLTAISVVSCLSKHTSKYLKAGNNQVEQYSEEKRCIRGDELKVKRSEVKCEEEWQKKDMPKFNSSEDEFCMWLSWLKCMPSSLDLEKHYMKW
jgi:hypothetical protein